MKPMARVLSYSVFVALWLSSTARAEAPQTLADFIQAGRKNALSNQDARVEIERKRAEKGESFGRLFPSISASGGYRYNLRDVNFCLPEMTPRPVVEEGEEPVETPEAELPLNECEIYSENPALDNELPPVMTPDEMMSDENTPLYRNRNIILLPHHQYDFGVTVRVPILDLEAIHRYRAAKHRLSSSAFEAEVIAMNVDLEVTQTYYQLAEVSAMVSNYQARLESANNLLEVVRERTQTGTAQPLEEEAALLDIKRIKQIIASYQRAQKSMARTLKNLTAIKPNISKLEKLTIPTSLGNEVAVGSWLKEMNKLASIKGAEFGVRSSDAELQAAKSRYLPKFTVEGSQRYTSIDGLEGRNNYYYVGVNAQIDFDFSKDDTVRVARAAKKSSKIRLEEARRNAEDAIYEAYNEIEQMRDELEFAQAQRAYTENAALLVRSNYNSGLVALATVFRAEKDLYEHKAQEIQAYTNYLYAKAKLRIVAGKDLSAKKKQKKTAVKKKQAAKPKEQPSSVKRIIDDL